MKLRTPKLAPHAVVLLVCCAVLGALVLIRYLTPLRSEVNISLYERRFMEPEAKKQRPAPTSLEEVVGDHSVYYRAERLRELSDVTLCLELYYLKRATAEGGGRYPPANVPESVEALLEGTKEAGLLPPGMTASRNFAGALNSPHSTLYVRYRPRPFGLEVISVPQGSGKEGGLMMRLPGGVESRLPAHLEAEHRAENMIHDIRPVDDSPTAMFATAEEVAVRVPQTGFAPVEELLSLGWSKVSLPAPQSLPPNDARRLKEWMRDPK